MTTPDFSYHRQTIGKCHEIAIRIAELEALINETRVFSQRDRDDLLITLTRAETIVMSYKKRFAISMAKQKGAANGAGPQASSH